MDKETLSNYGWVVICVLVLVVMIALATPFGKFIANAVKNTTKGLFGASESALNKGLSQATGVTIANPGDIEFDTTVDRNTDSKLPTTSEAFDIPKFQDACQQLTGKITFSKEKYPGTNGIDIGGNNYVIIDGNNATVYSTNGGKISCPNSKLQQESWRQSYLGIFFKFEATELDLSGLDTSGTTNMENMFLYCNSLTVLDVSGFDTHNVENMGCMFSGCYSLTTINGLEKFNTSRVTDMNNMFSNCVFLTSIKGLSTFDTSNVIFMDNIFYKCHSFTILDLSHWDTSNVICTHGIFESCESLTTVICRTQTDLNRMKASLHCPETINFVVKGQ